MFILSDKTLGFVVRRRKSDGKYGIITTREKNVEPISITWVDEKWLRANAKMFDQYDYEKVAMIFVEHAKTIGAAPDALKAMILFISGDAGAELSRNTQKIAQLYETYASKNGTSATYERPVSKAAPKAAAPKAAAPTVAPAITVDKIQKRVAAGSMYTADEVAEIKAIEDDTQLRGPSKPETARRIIIKYYGQKSDEEMTAILRNVWTLNRADKTVIPWCKNQLIKNGILEA